jgi:pimeloyl-ACP methyl ester carboxylesterase
VSRIVPVAALAALASAGLLAAACLPSAREPAASPAPPDPVNRSPALARYYDQRPAWRACEDMPGTPASYQCATVTVPLDYARPGGRTLRLRVSRIRTSVPGKRRGVLLFNPGGPGNSGLGSPLQLKDVLARTVRDRYDLIGFDPRGLATSSPLRCGLTQDQVDPFHPYRATSFAKDTARARAIATKCAARNGAVLPYINTRNTARDMDVVRGVLGEKRLSYVGWSYGTYLGAVYTQLFPGRSDRFVLDSAPDPNRFGRATVRAMAAGSEPAFRDWSRLVARRDATYHLGDTPTKVRTTFWRLVDRADRTPVRYTGDDAERQGDVFTGADIRQWLREDLFDAPDQAARKLMALRRSPTAGTAPLPGPAVRAEATDDNATALYWSIVCGDNSASWPRDPARYRRDALRGGTRRPLYGDFTANITPCAFWPRGSEPATRVGNAAGALVVQNQWDSQTPAPGARALHHALRGSRLVYVRGGRGHIVYGMPDAPACVTRTVDTYLAEGTLPKSDVTCRP